MLKNQKERKFTFPRSKKECENRKTSFQPRNFYPRVVNFTNVTFDGDGAKLLEKGLKFGLPPQKRARTFNTLVADLMVGLRDNTAAASQCAKIIKPNFLDLNIPPPPTKVMKSIQN